MLENKGFNANRQYALEPRSRQIFKVCHAHVMDMQSMRFNSRTKCHRVRSFAFIDGAVADFFYSVPLSYSARPFL